MCSSDLVRHGIAERHAELDHIGAGGGQAAEDRGRGLMVRIARGDEGDEPRPALFGERFEAPFDTGIGAAHRDTPSASATSDCITRSLKRRGVHDGYAGTNG